MFLPQKLKELRQKSHYSQTDVANEFGISRTACHMWESGKTKPNQKNLLRLAEFFGVETAYFEAEHDIVEIYLQLNQSNQLAVMSYAKQKLEEQGEEGNRA